LRGHQRILIMAALENMRKCQFHHNFKHAFLLPIFWRQKITKFGSVIFIFGAKISAKKLFIKCWWNWPQVSKTMINYAIGTKLLLNSRYEMISSFLEKEFENQYSKFTIKNDELIYHLTQCYSTAGTWGPTYRDVNYFWNFIIYKF